VSGVDVEATGRRPWRLGPAGQQWFDAALVAGLLAITAGTLVIGQPVLVTLLSAGQVGVLLWRRTRPTAVFAGVWLLSGVQALTYEYPAVGQLAYPVALYSLARFGRPRDARVGLALSLFATGVAAWVWVTATRYDVPPPGVEQPELSLTSFLPYLLSVGAIVVASWALGTQARIRRAYEAALMERGERMAAEAERRTQAAAAEERTRVAREMHDVVAHGITGMIVQADGARYAAEQDPAVAVRTLETVATTGREALTEMRRLLGLLRGTSDPELVPQPGLADLPRLVAADVGSGRVRASLPDPVPDVPDGVALTVFRVVQESLTNVRKHAGPQAVASVTLVEDGPDLVVTVEDDGRGAATPGSAGGLGLVGMRERVAVHGGTLDVGPGPGGGWRVRARIPR
jgi:signal transduction histidine kinase